MSGYSSDDVLAKELWETALGLTTERLVHAAKQTGSGAHRNPGRKVCHSIPFHAVLTASAMS